MSRLTRPQLAVAILAAFLVVVVPSTIAVWQAFTSDPMVPTIAKWLQSRGWDVNLPDWAPFVIPPAIGAVMFFILLVQLRQQHIAAQTGGDQLSDRRDAEDPPISFSIGANSGQIAGVNRGLMHQTVHQYGPQPRTLRSSDLEQVRQRLVQFQGTTFHIARNFGDAEAEGLARELLELLRSAGWVNDQRMISQVVRTDHPVGVLVEFPGTEDSPENTAMVALAEELLKIGIHTEGRRDAKANQVFVGTRP